MFKFSLVTVPSRPPTDDLDKNLAFFLSDIGYIPRVRPDSDMQSILSSAYYRLIRECFLEFPDRYWSPDELLSYLSTSRTTLYRHLNKLKSMDILEEGQDGRIKKYRLRSGDLLKAWSWVEINIKIAMEGYRKSVEKIEALLTSAKKH
ncbi:MAG: winged helix-turn-helix domain-containing protein [Candidatus Thermoplasmatota archaeon]|nr:winged helix-turn-helix domain-containing protein [Candidatus Thermoplasmatota archaeon]MCL5731182.1 winged helix-turn-helix domain-containing protein [Candidatus Thermoplasmatota archaeon]